MQPNGKCDTNGNCVGLSISCNTPPDYCDGNTYYGYPNMDLWNSGTCDVP